ncbi:MAG: hypothetical protein AAB691_02835 [Patescibacteria group bacterium]
MSQQGFQLKFIDIMVAVVLGLGFQWWPELKEPWQYIAFIFAYFNLVDYWIDYNPAAKKYTLGLEIDIVLHTLIIFSMFLLVFSAQQSLSYFLFAFGFYRATDILWLCMIKAKHKKVTGDIVYVNTWLVSDIVESSVALGLGVVALYEIIAPLYILISFVLIRVCTRLLSSVRYKKIFYAF